MGRMYLSPEQQLRAQQVQKAHTNMKQLEEAAAEALKYQDKYLNSMEKVMTCLLDSADTWEDVRTHLRPAGTTMMDPIGPSGGRLAASYNTWKVSKELRVLREQLEGLHEVSKAGRAQTKKAKVHVEKTEAVAKNCAEVNASEYAVKAAQRSDKAKEKMLKEKAKANADMAAIDQKVENDLRSIGTWWAARLVCCCEEVYVAFNKIGQRSIICFADGASQQALPYVVPTIASGRLPNGFGAATIAQASIGRVPTTRIEVAEEVHQPGGYYNAATGTAGVPLQFGSQPQHAPA